MNTYMQKTAVVSAIIFLTLISSTTFAQSTFKYKKRVDNLVVQEGPSTPGDTLSSFDVSTNLLNIPAVLAGATGLGSVLVQNQGAQPITFSSIAVQGTSYSATHACSTLSPGASCAIDVYSTSATRGSYSGSLILTGNGVTKTVGLTSKFLKGVASFDTTQITFGSLFTNKAYSQNVTLSNTGDANLIVTGISSSSTEFSTLNNCNTLTPGSSCLIPVSTLSSSLGEKFTNLIVESNTGNYSLSASATFEDPVLVFEAMQGSSLVFNPVLAGQSSQIVLNAHNNSTLPLTNISISESANDLGISGSSCTGILSPGASCQATLTWNPATGLDLSSPVTFNSDELSTSLTVTGVANKAKATLQGGGLVLGTVGQYAASTSLLTFKNTGTIPMTLSGLSGLPSGMTVSANNCSSVAVGSTCSMTVALNTYTGAIQNTVSVSTIGADVNASLNASYSIVNSYASCGAIRDANGSAASGVYVIDPDGTGGLAPVSVYCDMSIADGGPWMLAARILTANTDHSNVASVGTLSGPGQVTSAKLADTYINAFVKTHFYLKTDSGYKTFFQHTGVSFSAIFSATNRPVSVSYSGPYVSYGVNAAHGGLNSYGNSSSFLPNGIIYGDAGSSSACRKGLAINQVVPWCSAGVSGTMWIK